MNVDELSSETFDIEQVLQDVEFKEIPAGTYTARIEGVEDIQSYGEFPQATVHFRIVGGKHNNRRLGFQRLPVWDIVRMFRAAGVVIDKSTFNTERAIFEGLNALAESNEAGENLFGIRVDWQGFSVDAYNQALMEQTGSPNVRDAKAFASSDQKKSARAVALVCSTMTDFETDEDGEYQPVFTDPVTGDEKRARVRIQGFTKAREEVAA